MKAGLTAKHYKLDGTVTDVQPRNRTDFTLEELKEFIGGGYIEIVRLDHQRILVCDEEGKLKHFAINLLATQLWHQVYGPTDFIVGDVLVCSRRLVK